MLRYSRMGRKQPVCDTGARIRSFDLPASLKKRGYPKKSDTPARSFALCAQDGFRAETNK
jgi:hypothetical protein